MDIVAAVLAVAVIWLWLRRVDDNVRIRTLRYCYHVLAYRTPPEDVRACLAWNRELMYEAGMKPIMRSDPEPHPFDPEAKP